MVRNVEDFRILQSRTGILNKTAPGGTTWDTPWKGDFGYAKKRRMISDVLSTVSCHKVHITLRHTRGGNKELQSISIQFIAKAENFSCLFINGRGNRSARRMSTGNCRYGAAPAKTRCGTRSSIPAPLRTGRRIRSSPPMRYDGRSGSCGGRLKIKSI